MSACKPVEQERCRRCRLPVVGPIIMQKCAAPAWEKHMMRHGSIIAGIAMEKDAGDCLQVPVAKQPMWFERRKSIDNVV